MSTIFQRVFSRRFPPNSTPFVTSSDGFWNSTGNSVRFSVRWSIWRYSVSNLIEPSRKRNRPTPPCEPLPSKMAQPPSRAWAIVPGGADRNARRSACRPGSAHGVVVCKTRLTLDRSPSNRRSLLCAAARDRLTRR